MLKRKKRYGESGDNRRWLNYLLALIFAPIAFVLILSLVRGVNPIDLVKEMLTEKTTSKQATTQELKLETQILKQQNIIDSLEQRILILQGLDSLTRAIVKVNSSHLNVRTGPSIAAELSFKIAPESEVGILEYDKSTYVLDGKTGRWCKIIFKGNEGWVWGNYLEIQND